MFRASLIAASVALAALPATAFAQASNVDLNRFDGRWFEIERNHNNVQKDCSRAQIDFTPQGAAARYAITITCVRHTEALPLPKGLKDRPALGRAVVGVFADSNPVVAETVEDAPDAV